MGSTTVTVRNVAPLIESLQVDNAFENGIVTLSGTYSDVGTQDTHTITIDWGDGNLQSVDVTGGVFSIQHVYLDDSPTSTPSDLYLIRVQLEDDDLSSDVDSITTVVTNVAPIVSVSLTDDSIDEGESAFLLGTILDSGTLDTFTLSFIWGDPLSPNNTQSFDLGNQPLSASVDGINWNPSTREFSIEHLYVDDTALLPSSDYYQIQVFVSDDDSGSAEAGTSIVVGNIAPTLDVSQSSIIQDVCHTEFTISGSFYDPGPIAIESLSTGEMVRHRSTRSLPILDRNRMASLEHLAFPEFMLMRALEPTSFLLQFSMTMVGLMKRSSEV